jgi:hypothetical protein
MSDMQDRQIIEQYNADQLTNAARNRSCKFEALIHVQTALQALKAPFPTEDSGVSTIPDHISAIMSSLFSVCDALEEGEQVELLGTPWKESHV